MVRGRRVDKSCDRTEAKEWREQRYNVSKTRKCNGKNGVRRTKSIV